MRADQPIEGRGQIVYFLLPKTGRAQSAKVRAQQLAGVLDVLIGRRPGVDALQLDSQPEAMTRGRDNGVRADQAGEPGIATTARSCAATHKPEFAYHAVSGAEL